MRKHIAYNRSNDDNIDSHVSQQTLLDSPHCRNGLYLFWYYWSEKWPCSKQEIVWKKWYNGQPVQCCWWTTPDGYFHSWSTVNSAKKKKKGDKGEGWFCKASIMVISGRRRPQTTFWKLSIVFLFREMIFHNIKMYFATWSHVSLRYNMFYQCWRK